MIKKPTQKWIVPMIGKEKTTPDHVRGQAGITPPTFDEEAIS